VADELRLTLLAGLRLARGEAPLTGLRKELALLCYLAVTGRPHSRAELAGLLWADMPDAQAAGNLRKALSNLNDIAGPHLSITRQEVAFNRAGPYWLDVERFASRVQTGLPDDDPAAWREAVGLYRGDFLQGFYVRDAPAFEDWMLQEREQLRGLAVRALQRLADYEAAHRDYAAALEHTRRWLALEPWREEAHRQLMTLLARSRQRSAALAQYEICRRVLRDELGVEPAPETAALAEHIRLDDLAPPNNLPAMPTAIVGRQPELAQIARYLDRPECRLLTLVGLSGMGKTRLALEAARRQIDRFPDGVFWVPLAGVRSADFLIPALAEAVGLVLHGGDQPGSQLFPYFSEKRLLLLLDSFERVLDAAEVVARLLAQAPGVKVLATSTERLHLQGEWLLSVGGLSVPEAAVGPALEEHSAVQMFVQRAQPMGLRLPLAEAEQRCVARICRLVEGMPLAIELAAAWVRAVPCCEIAAEIERNRDFLASTVRDRPERHQSIRSVFDYSWSTLAPAQRAVLSRLAIFRNGFERDAAQRVADASLAGLSALVDQSLLARNEADRYQLHDLIRHYAREKLEQGSAETPARDRHLDYYLGLAERADPQLHGPQQLAWLDRLEVEHDNLRSALEWALRRAQDGGQVRPEAALRLAGSLGLFWDLRGHFKEGRQWLEQALALQPSPAGPAWRAARSQALYWAGHLAKWQGDYRRAAELAEANLALCRAQGSEWAVGYALYLAGSVANKQGDLARAQAHLAESLTLFRQVHARWGLAHTLGTLGNIARAQGRYDQALACLEESHALYREIGDRRGLARTLNRLWQVPYQNGDFARAGAYLDEALALFREIKHRDGVAIILRHLGLVAQAQGSPARARRLYEESRVIFQDLGDNDDLAYAIGYLGQLELEEGNAAAARRLLEQARSLAEAVGNPELLAWVGRALAAALRRE
jgi:predicted ATPase/DNA-binding SARP family transcriptional activator